jgi:sterol desaturase/sphingolipid hydroxylase (fatty acid hydroxylase superfamily)
MSSRSGFVQNSRSSTSKLAQAWQIGVPICALLLLFELAARAGRMMPQLVEPLHLWPVVQEVLLAVIVFAIVNTPLMVAERLWPGTSGKRHYLDGGKFWLIYLIISYGWAKAATLLRASMAATPLIAWRISSDSSTLVITAGILLWVFVFDFFYYWFHRAQHRFSGLWSFHRVHHSIVHLNCLNSYHHVTEEIFRFPFIALPLALLIEIDVPQLVLLSAFVAAWTQYIHSDTRVHFGRLWPYFSDNSYHRIHHSTERKYFDKNFAAFFPFWDRLFGTYCEPDRDALCEVGLFEAPAPRTIRDYLLMPFRQNADAGDVSHAASSAALAAAVRSPAPASHRESGVDTEA